MENRICCFALICENCETVVREKEKRVKVKPVGEPLYNELKKVFRKKNMKAEKCCDCGHDVLVPTYFYNEI